MPTPIADRSSGGTRLIHSTAQSLRQNLKSWKFAMKGVTMTQATLTEEEFNQRFGVLAIHLRLAKCDSLMDMNELRSREAEQAFIRRFGIRSIWTLVIDPDGDMYLLSGMHFVKRIGLVASHRPAPPGPTVIV